jgi:ferredoxin
MDRIESKTVVGYSVFEIHNELYQYNENECYIADTKEIAEDFMNQWFEAAENCRIDAITIDDIMLDYGASCGSYAMELPAFAMFKRVAELNGITYSAEPFYGDDTLIVVEVDGTRSRNEDE